MHRNYKLLILLLALIATSAVLSVSSGDSGRSDFVVDQFTVTDTSAIEVITIAGNHQIKLERGTGGKWVVNEQHAVNNGLKTILLAVLNQVRVRRPVSQLQKAEIAMKLQDQNTITVSTTDGELKFWAGGNAAKTTSYFMLADEEQPYIMEIPGYRNYISGLFELTPTQWRDRKLFSTHWRSLQLLEVNYPDRPADNLSVYFEDEFFRVGSVNTMDTTTLMTYLQKYELFEANEFIPVGFSAKYDSLARTDPYAIINLEEINKDKNQSLSVFPKLTGDTYILTSNKDGELSLVDAYRIQSLLRVPDSFNR